jgi:metal-sulfur cluster biosynthetic enzyme
MPTKAQIIAVLKSVPDPELQISVWDLGLIYDVKVGKKGDVVIVMTLTSQGCPLFSMMEEPIKRKVKKLKGVKSVTIHLTFDPPWDTEKMSKKGKKALGLL